MNYSVFILHLEDTANAKEFIGDVGLGEALTNVGANMVESLVGVDIFDKYAEKLKHGKSVALTGDVVKTVRISTAIAKRTNFDVQMPGIIAGTNGKIEDVVAKDLKTVITVVGHLTSPDTLFGLGNKVAKKKDTSNLLKWANESYTIGMSPETKLHKKLSFRHIIVSISSMDQKRFRGIFIKNVTLESYEEFYDEHGEGYFTLVVSRKHTSNEDDQANFEMIEGPTFKWNSLSLVKDISKVAKQASKDVDKLAGVSEKVLGKDNEITQKLKTASKKTKGAANIANGLDNVLDGGDLMDEIGNQADLFRKDFQDEDSKKNTIKTFTKALSDGNTETTVVKLNADGKTKTVHKEIKHKDGTVEIDEQVVDNNDITKED